MEKIVKCKNKLLKSALFLTVAGFITKIIGVLYKVPLLEIVGSEGLGYYQLIFPIFIFALILSSGGITTTLSKIIAKSENETQKDLYFKICLVESLILSVIVSVLLLIFCEKIAAFQGGASLKDCYKILCPAIVSCAIISSLRGYFQGCGNMKYTAWSQLIEQFGKIALGLFFSFVFIKNSVVKSIYGIFLGLSISEVVCAIYLVCVYKLYQKSKKTQKTKLFQKITLQYLNHEIKIFNKELLPITLTSQISPLFSAINSMLIIDLLFKAGISSNFAVMLFGLSGVVISLVTLPCIVSSALSTTIFPIICSQQKSESEKSNIISFSFKVIFAVCVPCILVFILFSKPIVSLLYSEDLSYGNINQLEIASKILKIVSPMVLYNSVATFSTTLLQAKNKSFKACSNILFGSIITLIVFVFFVKNPHINILGDGLAMLIGLSVTAFLNLKDLTKTDNFKLKLSHIFVSPLIASGFMIFVMQMLFKSLSGVVPHKIVTVLACFTGFAVYMLLIFTLKVFSIKEIGFLKTANRVKNEVN